MKFRLFPLLHRCIMRELLLTFGMCVLALISLILIGRGLQMRELFLGLEISLADVGLLFLYMIPMFLIMVLPISCMVSVFLTFLRMSTDRELVALKAGGVSVYQMLRSPAVFSFVCMCFAIFISLHGIAWGMNQFRITVLDIANNRATVAVQPGVFNKDIMGLTLFARKVDPVSGRLSQVIFEDQTQADGSSVTVLAPEGEIVTDQKRGALIFQLQNGRVYRVNENNVSILDFDEYEIGLDLSQVFSGFKMGDVRPQEMEFEDLRTIQKQRMGFDGDTDERYLRRIDVEIEKRWSLPVACLVLGIFALPLACAFEGVKRQLGVILAMLAFLVYYSVYSLGVTMGTSGVLPPIAGLWLANSLFFFAAVLGLHLTYKERTPMALQVFSHIKRLLRFRKGVAAEQKGQS